MQHADDVALDQQRDAEHRADPLLPQDRVDDVGVVEVLDEDRAPLGRDPAGEAAPDRDPDALLDLLLDALGGGRHELAGLVEQQERGRVGRRMSAIRSSSSISSSSSGRYASAHPSHGAAR